MACARKRLRHGLPQKAIPLAFNRRLEPVELKLAMELDWEHTSVASVSFDESVNRMVMLTLEGTAYAINAELHDHAGAVTLRGRALPVTDADAVTFDSQHRCWVSHQVDRVTAFDLETGETLQRIHTSVQGWRKVNRYLLILCVL